MTLLAILLSLAFEKLVPTVSQYRRYDWFFSYKLWLREKLSAINNWNDSFSFVIIIVLPVLGVAFIHYQLFAMLSILGFLFSVLVLIYCLGPKDIHSLAQQLAALSENENPEDVRAVAAQLIHGPLPENDAELYTAVKEKLLIATNGRVLAVFFWFSILGPMGALLYRLASISIEPQPPSDDKPDSSEYQYTAQTLFSLLNWLPAHITALSYGVTGNFVDALQQWKQNAVKNHLDGDECENMLIKVGLGASGLTDSTKADTAATVNLILAMAKRSVILWLTLLALLTMSGWAG